MGDTSETNFEDNRRLNLTETVVHVRVPERRLFMCGSEPPSIPAMVEALKLFIHEASSTIFKLEIERQI